ncbi:ABC transporter permease [Bacteriovoracaceae bacterium]|nr:ABC transporter permease [Bacteriovoracaceae bacterium]
MILFFKLGYRNLFRNKRRSILTSLAIGVGLASLMLMDGFWGGMTDNVIRNVTDTYLGHMQVHHYEYLDTMDNEKMIQDGEQLFNEMKQDKNIASITKRTMSVSMISSAEDSNNIILLGIEPELEKNISLFQERIIKGQFIEKDIDIVVGSKLLEKLGVDLGGRVVVTLSDVNTGELSQELFRVSGVFHMGNKQMDEQMALALLPVSQRMLGVKNGIHELAFRLNDDTLLDNKKYWSKYSSQINKIVNWKEKSPGIMGMLEMTNQSTAIIVSILLVLVGLGILNTLFMALYERIFEFGVLRSLGTRSSELIIMIMSEAASLSLMSIVFGVILSTGLGTFWYFFGVDYSGIEFGEITFTEKIYFVFTLKQYTFYPLLIFIFTILVSIYPGIHAARLTMAQALKKAV